MRNLLTLAALALALPAAAQTGPKFGKNGGVGSATSTIATGEPVGGTFSINGATGQATFRSQTIGDPTDSSAVPVAVKTKGPTPSLAIGTSLYPTNVGGSGAAKYDATSNILTNALGAKYGIFGAAAKDNVTWANSYISGIDATGHAQVYSVSTSGVYGGAFASRSSDIPGAAQDTIGSVSLGVADSTTQSNSVWGGYDAAYGASGAFPRGLIGREISLINRGSAPSLGDPYNFNAFGFTNALRLDCGDGVSTTSGCSSAMTIVPNAGQAKSGIVFADGSLVSSGGYAPAIAMPSGYGMSWYSATAQPTWRILSNAGGSQLGQMVLGDSALDLYMTNGSSHPLGVNPVGIASPNAVIGNPADSGDSAITTSTTNLQVLRKASNTPASTGVGGANEFPLFSSITVPAGHGGGIDYEVAALYGRCSTKDPNTAGNAAYDCVGMEAQGISLAPSQLNRVWGNNNVVHFLPGSDGMGTGYETDVLNESSVGALQTPQQKLGYVGVCRSYNDCTAAYVLTSDGVAKWRYGFVGVRQNLSGDCFSCLLEGLSPSLPIYAGIFSDGHTLAQGSSIVTGQPGTTRYQTFMSGPNASALVKRWDVGANGTAESFGTNAGSDYQICRYGDDGSFLSCPLLVQRSSGSVFVENAFTASKMQLRPIVFSNLPTCNTAAEGSMAYITDASAPVTAWHQAVTAGGGTTKTFVQCAGTGWQAF